ncbi:MAG: nuclear transport factor 2 family protein [Pseudomonadota bacterium]
MDEQAAVQQADDQFFAALNAMFVGELEPMMTLWSHADDVVYMGPDGVFQVGWAAVRQDWEKQAALKLGGEIHVVDRRFTVGEQLAAAYHVAKGSNLDADGIRREVTIRGTNLFRQEEGTWKLVAHHSDPLPFLK